MTRYCVQISRWFNVEAGDEAAAEEVAFGLEYTAPTVAIANVTDLDAIEQGSSAAECGAHNLEVAGATPAPASSPQAPIAKVVVGEDDSLLTMLYAPGLPPGEHDLYCEPASVARCLPGNSTDQS